MEWINGVSPCWWLSTTCVVNWNAWSAIATGAATGLALVLACREMLSRSRSAKYASIRTKIALHPHVHNGAGAIANVTFNIAPEVVIKPEKLRNHLNRLAGVIAAIEKLAPGLSERDGLRLATATSLAQYLLRQSTRLADGEEMVIYSADIRKDWTSEGQKAVQLFFDLESEYKKIIEANAP